MSSAPGGMQRYRCDEVEYKLLGAVFSDAAALPAARAVVRQAADFGLQAHATLWQAACDLADADLAVDLDAAVDMLRARDRLNTIEGAVRLRPLALMPADLDRVETWARRVAAHARARRVATAVAAGLAKLDDGDEPDAFADAVAEAVAVAARATDALGESWLDEDIGRLYGTMSDVALGKVAPVRPLHSGLVGLDNKIGGLRPGQLYVVAGRTGQGKTALATTMALRAAVSSPHPVMVASLEMTAEDMAGRSLSMLASVEQGLVRAGAEQPIGDEALEQLSRYAALPALKHKVRLVTSADLTVTELRARARRLQATHGLALVIVDYLQLVKAEAARDRGGRSPGREREVAEISRGLKRLALELRVPVVALSQLNRAADERETPVLSDIRESGAIEHDATAIVFIWPAEDPARARIIVAKSRFGPCGEFEARFVREYTRFDDVEDA